MPNYAYIVMLRNDVPPGAIQLTDLRPNSSQRSLIYEPGSGQSGYLNPANVPDNAVITALAASDPDGAGGNDHNSTAATEYGLQAYIRDRVNVNPGTLDRSATTAEALAIADAIVDAAQAGSTLDLAAINVLINANAAGADSDLDGTAAASESFGTVEGVLRILSGEVYRMPANTVVELTAASAWRSTAQRVAAVGANTQNFFTQGVFTTSTLSDPAHKGIRRMYVTGSLQISMGEGVLSKLTSTTFVLDNPKFSYGAGGTAQFLDIAGTVVPANANGGGTGAVCAVYDNAGKRIS